MYTVNTHDMIYLERIFAELIGSQLLETILLFHTVHISSGVWHKTQKCCIKCLLYRLNLCMTCSMTVTYILVNTSSERVGFQCLLTGHQMHFDLVVITTNLSK